jgi:transcriptional regulator with XRE-family HTH domain
VGRESRSKAVEEQAPQQVLNDLQHFGNEVREARQGKGLTQKQLGKGAGNYSESYVSKVEAGALLCSEKFANGCDLVLGSSGIFARLRERITKRDHPAWFQPRADLEREARSILEYSANLIPGLLQTAEYAEALTRAQHPEMSEEQLAARVNARGRRREILTWVRPPKLWVVLHETTLLTRIGGDQLMTDQLTGVLADARAPRITVQVLPFARTPPVTEAFTLLAFSDRSAIAYADTAMSGQVTDEAEAVTRLDGIYDRLRAEALPPAESAALISTYLERYSP